MNPQTPLNFVMATLVAVDGKYESPCGYCQHRLPEPIATNQQRPSFGIHVYQPVPTPLYDDMIQRNWRRCGHLYYVPYNATHGHMVCCPQYAIRTDAMAYRMPNAHRRVIRRLGAHLCSQVKASVPKKSEAPLDIVPYLTAGIQAMIHAHILPSDTLSVVASVQVGPGKQGNNVWTSSFMNRCVALYAHRMKRPLDRSAAELVQLWVKHLAPFPEHVDGVEAHPKGFLNISLKKQDEEQPSASVKAQESNNEVRHRFRLTVCDANGVKQDEFEAYRRYQVEVHGDAWEEVTETGYQRFLCKSSLQNERTHPADAYYFQMDVQLQEEQEPMLQFSNLQLPPQGSIHVRYELVSAKDDDDHVVELVGVSVLDVLPTGLSSVYFFYDPAYRTLSPGVLSGVVELMWIQALADTQLKYYYLGFYIHHCSKMKYKAQFEPSSLLCPITYQWTPLDDRLRSILDRMELEQRLLPFAVDSASVETEPFTLQDNRLLAVRQGQRPVMVMGSQMPSLPSDVEQDYKEFHRLMSHRLFKQCVLILPA